MTYDEYLMLAGDDLAEEIEIDGSTLTDLGFSIVDIDDWQDLENVESWEAELQSTDAS